MSRTTTAVVLLAAGTLALAGCGGGGVDAKPTASASAGSGLNAGHYLYGLDGDKHSRKQVDALLAALGARCTGDLGVLVSAATVTAVDVTDAKGTQTTYGVLEKLAAGLPSSGKVPCQGRLPRVEKALKAGR